MIQQKLIMLINVKPCAEYVVIINTMLIFNYTRASYPFYMLTRWCITFRKLMIQLLLIVFGFKVINHHTERKFANLPNAFIPRIKYTITCLYFIDSHLVRIQSWGACEINGTSVRCEIYGTSISRILANRTVKVKYKF